MFLFTLGVLVYPTHKVSATVSVAASAAALTASSGGNTSISWTSSGDPDSCTVTNSVDDTSVVFSGSFGTQPTSALLSAGKLTATTTFTIKCEFKEYCSGTYTVLNDGYCANSPTSDSTVTGSRSGTTVPGPYEDEYCVDLSQGLCETGGWLIHGCGAGWTPNVYNCSGLKTTSTCGAHSTCKWIAKSEDATVYYTVSTSAGVNGTISPTSKSVASGTTTTFTIAPAGGYLIGSVTGCSGTLSGTTYTTGAITGACTVTATFKVPSYLVTTTANTGGSISPTSTTVAAGSIASFRLTPSSGYKVCSAIGCDGTLSGLIYDTGVINAACTVTVSFAASTNYCLIDATETELLE